jgi:hypothetical protein
MIALRIPVHFIEAQLYSPDLANFIAFTNATASPSLNLKEARRKKVFDIPEVFYLLDSDLKSICNLCHLYFLC